MNQETFERYLAKIAAAPHGAHRSSAAFFGSTRGRDAFLFTAVRVLTANQEADDA
jgi:hypothetical protein